MPKRLSGSAGTGKKIWDNWELFSFTFNQARYEEYYKDGSEMVLYPFDVKFGNQKGYMSISVKNGTVLEGTLINCKFPRPLGAYNDPSLYEVAERMLRESGIRDHI